MDIDDIDANTSFHEEASLPSSALQPSTMALQHERYLRENRRLRNSASFRLGLLLTRAISRPWRIVLFPFQVLHLVYSLILERLGHRPKPYSLSSESDRSATYVPPQKDCVVLFPTNGVGFGHFTRMYAFAKRIQRQQPNTEIVFFTTMPTLHLLYSEGFPTYHVAGRKMHKDLSAAAWNALVEEQLNLVFNLHRPKMFVFDGAYPYRGMLNALQGRSYLNKVWMRRGAFKTGSNIPIDSIEHFDLIVRPEDSVAATSNELEHTVKVELIPPIVLLEADELLPRNSARARLRLPKDAKVVYVQLGAGKINNIQSEVRLTVDALLANEDVVVVLGESMLGGRLDLDVDRLIVIRDYPNSMYFNAFDATVQAGGYNSYHEVRKFGMPTVFYPNMSTGMDDQLARCLAAEDEGWGLVVRERTAQHIAAAIDRLLHMERRPVVDEDDGATSLTKQMIQRGWL